MKRPNDECKESTLKLKRNISTSTSNSTTTTTSTDTRDMKCNFEKLTTNIDVMLHIYKLLDLKDQLQLCLCSDQLKWIFEMFVWRISYKKLFIIGFAHNFVVHNETMSHSVCLPYDEYQLFLQVFAYSVQTLNSNYDAVPDLRLFSNVKTLSYRFTKSFTKESLRSIAENCRQLRELHVMYCGTRYLNFIDLEDVLDVKLLQQIPNLNNLSLIDFYPDNIKYHHWLEIITKTKLRGLRLSASIVPDETVVDVNEVAALKCLHVVLPLSSNRWPSNYASIWNNFKGLTYLTLRGDDVITTDILQSIADNCEMLETLQFVTSNFRDIKNFAIPGNLTTLTFYRCKGLNYANLRQLLTQFKLKSFSSDLTEFKMMGELKDFQISPFIEKLSVTGNFSNVFPLACQDSLTLKELILCDSKSSHKPPLLVEIGSCINLQCLTIKSGFMPLTSLMQLKSLRKFSLPNSMPFLNWPYISLLLRHPTLEEINIGDNNPPTWVTKTTHIPSRVYRTNVKKITISMRIFLSALSFWLGLFNCNKELILACKNFEMNDKIIKHIVRHEHFPRDLKTVVMTGFSINVTDLKNNFEKTMGKFLYDSNYMKIIPTKLHHMTLNRNSHIITNDL